MATPFVIFAGKSRDELEPVVAVSNLTAALQEAQVLGQEHKCVEAIYMPEDEEDVNEIVFSQYKED